MRKVFCVKSYNNHYYPGFCFFKGETYFYTNKLFTLRKRPKGFNVQFSTGEYIFFDVDSFKKHFKTITQLRKEKLNEIYKK